jgi:hypothetical protein
MYTVNETLLGDIMNIRFSLLKWFQRGSLVLFILIITMNRTNRTVLLLFFYRATVWSSIWNQKVILYAFSKNYLAYISQAIIVGLILFLRRSCF